MASLEKHLMEAPSFRIHASEPVVHKHQDHKLLIGILSLKIFNQ
jgi:hypothetical protein